MAAPSELDLIEAARRDPARFSELYDANFHRVYAFLIRRTGRRQQAEDLTSEVFHSALRNLHQYEYRGAPFAAWLLKIAANALHNHQQRSFRETPEADRPVSVDPPSDPRFEQQALLFQLVDRLPDAQRQVIELRFIEQRSIQEVAAALGRSEGAIKQLQLRAIETLREQMEVRR